MSMPHLLMLGLIDGASVGLAVEPPATVGDLSNFSIDMFYIQDFKKRRRRLTPAQFKILATVIKINHSSKLKTIKDFNYYRELEANARLGLAGQPMRIKRRA